MKYYNLSEAAISTHGLNHVDFERDELWRLDPEIMDSMPQYAETGRCALGGRIRFATDSPTIVIRYKLLTEAVDIAMGLPAAAGIDIYIGSGLNARYAGYIAPKAYNYVNTTIEGRIQKNPKLETITINLPRNEAIAAVEIGIEDNRQLTSAPNYRYMDPIIYYGSSITAGGCAPRPGTAYTSTVARWLDSEYFNYGFSGGAKGENEFATYIAAHEHISLFVMDYDHNAPSAEHLARTHRPFFETVRSAHPNLPIVMMSRPDFDGNIADSEARRGIIYETFISAKSNGDQNVYFLDGESFFGLYGREECTIDGCHPNALGFMRMSEQLYPLLRRILTTEPDA